MEGVTGMTYTDQQKAAIITRYKQGASAQSLSAETGVRKRTIYRWAKMYHEISPDESRSLTAQ